MALQGTIKDFGVGDILQLIGQQQKSGVLRLHQGEDDVVLGFRAGAIVRVESSSRRRKELLGEMLVRAEVLTQAQLEAALDSQRRTLKRLGDVLVGEGLLTAERLRQTMQLQATETVYRLFTWKSGTYAFEPGEVEPDAITPLRAESVLMEGFRQVDEWPVIRRRLPRLDVVLAPARALPPPTPGEDDEETGGFARVGRAERQVHALVRADRDVRKLVDLSGLGEFETCKAVYTLLELGFLRVRLGARRGGVAGRRELARQVLGAALRGGLSAAVGVAVGALALARLAPGSTGAASVPADGRAVERFAARAQGARIGVALEVYRLEHGELPETLDALVHTGLLEPSDLTHPWREPYHYRRLPDGRFVLLPPLR